MEGMTTADDAFEHDALFAQMVAVMGERTADECDAALTYLVLTYPASNAQAETLAHSVSREMGPDYLAYPSDVTSPRASSGGLGPAQVFAVHAKDARAVGGTHHDVREFGAVARTLLREAADPSGDVSVVAMAAS